MFFGHFGVAFAAKTVVPRAPLWTLLVVCEGSDLLCFGFASAGLESLGFSQTDLANGVQYLVPGNVPYSHGLFMTLIWSALAAAAAYLFLRDRLAASILGLVVFSHWVLDFIVHPPDLPLFFDGSPLLGLGLWGSGPGLIASILLEFALLAGGVVLYIRHRQNTIEEGSSHGHPDKI